MGGDAGSGVAHQVSVHLSMLREGVEELVGGAVEVGRTIARSGPDDVLVVIDLPRYDRAVLDMVAWARGRGLRTIAVTDSSLSPVAAGADGVLTVQSHDVGPFDSYVSALAVGDRIYWMTTGAYTNSYSSVEFNGFPPLKTYYLD